MASRTARLGCGLAGLWLALAGGLMLAGCGAPQYTYVVNATAHTYFKVPEQWRKVSDASLQRAINGGKATAAPSGVWSVGYDAAAAPTGAHVLSAATTQPFVFAVVLPLSTSSRNAMSYDGLRDFLLPVTATGRQLAAMQGFPLSHFHLLRDTVLTPGQGIHGVRVTFSYRYPGGSVDTFDKVAFTNADETEVYVLLVHCLASCYTQHAAQINTVMSSFTVRS